MASHRGKTRSADTSRFAMVPRNDVPRSAFDIEHTHKTTFAAGYLIPILVDEVLPGDSLRVRMHALARLATPIVPVMDNLYLETFFFFVPNRLVWNNWERFMGEQHSPSDTTEFLVPELEIPANDFNTVGSLQDYFGISSATTPAEGDMYVNALPFRAYNLIWNDWFRDEDLQNRLPEDVSDGPDALTSYDIVRRGKRFDYFTAARPWPQKPLASPSMFGPGDPYVPGGNMEYPFAGAPVSGIGLASGTTITATPADFNETGTRIVEYERRAVSGIALRAQEFGAFPDVRVLINDIRTANAVQVMMEKNARGGTRYAELIRSHFGVQSPDARLQRPEYLGGGRTMVNVNPVAQTSASAIEGSTTVLGELGAIGTAVASGHGFSSSFTEHGFVIGLVSVRADLSYQQGIERMWFRRTMFDYYWPSLAHLGEQAILSREIFASGDSDDENVFGYIGRYDEYRYKPNRVSGAFRTSYSIGSLDFWHLAQWFGNPITGDAVRPTLSNSFIQENPPVERVLQVEDEPLHEFLFDSLFEMRHVRPMPMFAIPGLGPRL